MGTTSVWRCVCGGGVRARNAETVMWMTSLIQISFKISGRQGLLLTTSVNTSPQDSHAITLSSGNPSPWKRVRGFYWLETGVGYCLEWHLSHMNSNVTVQTEVAMQKKKTKNKHITNQTRISSGGGSNQNKKDQILCDLILLHWYLDC